MTLETGGVREPELASLIAIAETALTVRDIASYALWTIDPGMSLADARQAMILRGYDVAPLAESPLARYISLRDLDSADTSARLEEVAHSMHAEVLVTADLGLAEAIRLFKLHDFFFVLEGNQVTAIVSWSDLQKPAVSMVAMALILASESALNRLIPVFCGSQWLDALTPKQQQQVEAIYRARVRHKTEIGHLEFLMLTHRLALMWKTEAMRQALGFESGDAAEQWSRTVIDVRNTLAHGGGLLDIFPEPAVAVARLAAVRTFAESAWRVAQSIATE